MSNNIRRRLTLPEEKAAAPVVLQNSEEEFSKKLHYALLDRGWNQSDLARRIWGEETTDARGYVHVRGKDRISAYIRGKALPEPKTLVAIAKALNMRPEDLAPNLATSAIEKTTPEIEIKAIAGHHDRVLLKVTKLVSLATALKVGALLDESK